MGCQWRAVDGAGSPRHAAPGAAAQPRLCLLRQRSQPHNFIRRFGLITVSGPGSVPLSRMSTPMPDTPATAHAPSGWSRGAADRELLDIVHWAVRDAPVKSLDGSWPLGAALRAQVAAPDQAVAGGAAEIAKFCAPPAFQAELPFISTDAAARYVDAGTVAGVAVVNSPPAVVPISTSQHEDTQLRWD